jgi:hypothetical protein
MKSLCSFSALVISQSSKLRFKVAALAALAAIAIPASAQFHVQESQTAVVQAPADPRGWPATQAADLIALRSSSSPAEKKLSFNLFLITRKDRNALIASFTPLMDTRPVNSDGTINVEISAYLSPSLMASPVMERIVRANGGSIPVPAYVSDRFQARVTPRQLLDLAANPNVLFIRDINYAPSNASVTPSSAPLAQMVSR